VSDAGDEFCRHACEEVHMHAALQQEQVPPAEDAEVHNALEQVPQQQVPQQQEQEGILPTSRIEGLD
jgi:hypothetical protein